MCTPRHRGIPEIAKVPDKDCCCNRTTDERDSLMESLIDATPESWMDTLFAHGFIERYSGATRSVCESYQYYLQLWPDCFPSQERIAKNACVSVRTVRNVLRMLKKAGLISVKASRAKQAPDGTWSRSTNRYFVTKRGTKRTSCNGNSLQRARKARHQRACAAARKRYSTERQIAASKPLLKGSNRPAETVEVSRPVDISLTHEEKAASAAVLENLKRSLRLRN